MTVYREIPYQYRHERSLGPVSGLALCAATGSLCVMGWDQGEDLELELWDLRGGKRVGALPFPGGGAYKEKVPVRRGPVHWKATFSPDGRLLAVGGEEEVQLWAVAEGKRLHRFSCPGFVRSLAFDGGGKWLAAGTTVPRSGGGGSVLLWNLETGKEEARLGQEAFVNAVAVDQGGKRLNNSS
jgi:WD40 repeat protein